MAVSKALLLMVILFAATSTLGQSKEGHQRITISFENESLEQALLKLDSAFDDRLSYNPRIFSSSTTINGSFQSKSLEEILNELLANSYELKRIGNYMIIQKTKPEGKDKTVFQLKGGVRDASSGEELTNVSIYELNSLQSTLSDEQGAFALDAESTFEVATFVVSKRFYEDTIIQVTEPEMLNNPIVLRPEERAKQKQSIREQVRLFSSGLAKLFTSDKVRKNAQNVNFVDVRPFQLSLIPSIGTNRKLSGQIKNKASLNIIAGYAYGLRGIEMGGVYNINRNEVRGAQIGGFGNTVGGEVHGLQLGGFINTTKDYVRGFQIGGFINLASDSVNGFQMGGFTNVTREVKGLQIGGFSNHTNSTRGFQFSGFMNTTVRMDGLQVAGFMNVAKEVKGVQFSLLNIADSVASGLQLGLFNITKKNGFISPAMESDDVIPYRLVFRSGLDWFYSVLSIGLRNDEYWSYGAGFGSRLFLSTEGNTFINPELRWFNLSEGEIEEDGQNYLLRLNLNLGYQFKQLFITTGPSINFYSTNLLDAQGDPFIRIVNNPIVDEATNRNRYQLWVGYTFGIGF